ncbi:MAG: hypothetical protein LBL21_02900 [Rickettsiales bacterium]|jgi:hypothetical protein|nr:hypothetical protein [Rickettsiales bacterium]
MIGNRKILVGFATKTSAFLPSFFCALFRHCAVVIDGTLVQVGPDGIRLFRVRAREIGKLEAAGWVFVDSGFAIRNSRFVRARRTTNPESRIANPDYRRLLSTIDFGLWTFLTCVGFAKRALGIRAPFVWTPDQLFRLIVRG